MHVMAEYGKTQLFDWFIDYFDPDLSPQSDSGETPLMIAAKEGSMDIIRLLVTKYKDDIDINQTSKDGWTALMYASMNGLACVVEYLAKACGADINVTDRLGKNALHWASRFGNQKVVAILLQLKINYE